MSSVPVSPSEVPARKGLRVNPVLISALLVVIGLGITGYMSYNKLSGQSLPCTNEGFVNCSVVESSAWAYILGVPTAVWGFLAHLGIGGVLLLERRQSFFQQYGILIILGIAIFGVMYHAYLIYVSVAVLRAICTWCLSAAAVMLLQLITTAVRYRRSLAA